MPRETCVAIGYINMLTFTASVQSLAVISVNRYVKICRPSWFVDIYTFRNVFFMCMGVWIFSGLLSVPPLMGWAAYSYLPTASVCFCDWSVSFSYALFMIFICFCVPCLVMCLCNVGILRAYFQSRKALLAFGDKQFQLSASLLVVIVIFVISWFPYCVSMFVSVFSPELSSRRLDVTSLFLGYSNSCVNPIVYGVMNKKFRSAYRGIF
ncbi:unnamed protein product, partial [Lymnaea stagnalis]